MRHGALLSSLEQALTVLTRNMAALTQVVHDLVTRSTSVTPPPAAAAGAARGSYTCDPEPFDRNLTKCRGFLLQCQLVFAQRLLDLPTNETRINYVIRLLRGRMLAWGQASRFHLNTLPFEAFYKHLEQIFDRPKYSSCASDRLFTIQQGGRSVVNYDVEFRTLAEASWNRPALQGAFRQGLSGSVRDALVGGRALKIWRS